MKAYDQSRSEFNERFDRFYAMWLDGQTHQLERMNAPLLLLP